MKFSRCLAFAFLVAAVFPARMNSQQISAAQPTAVPRLVNFSGKATDDRQKPITGVAGITFSIYKGQYEGAALWIETQNVQADNAGNFTAQLGATKTGGMPLDLFTSGEARWLGVRVNGGQEQPRILLLSVPYALKAADAETVGGLPASAFVLASEVRGQSASTRTSIAPVPTSESIPPPPASTVTTSGGILNALPLWTTATNVQSSAITQTGSGATAKIGINTAAPTTALDVHGGSVIRGTFVLPATGTSTASAGKVSQPENFVASSFSSATSTPVNQTFQWQATPANNNTSNPGATLNLLYGLGATAPAQTGLRIGPKGIIGFAPGQTFPGTVNSVGFSAPSSDFTVSGSPVTGSGTLGLSWNIAPTSANTANAIVKRDIAGGFSAGAISAIASVGDGSGVFGVSISDGATGVSGTNTGSGGIGVYGKGSYGMFALGVDIGSLAEGNVGVQGAGGQYGVYGGGSYGVFGFGDSYGVWGETSGFDGVHGLSHSNSGAGVVAINDAASDGLFATSNGGFAGFFLGDVDVDGNLSKAGGAFKIDHPLDPANKYLYHSFVESPDMKNIYDGNATLDGNGEAFVPLPEWFQTLNRDFRYQLTCLDGFAPIYVAQRVQGNRFKIAGGKPGMEVSWQVTGIRQDAWANAHRIPVEQLKPEKERGSYLHPELFGAPEEKSIAWARHPETMKRAKERPPLPAPLRPAPTSAQR